MTARTWTITDIDGRNPREVTLAEFLAEHERKVAAVAPVAEAFRRGDIMAAAAAQARLRRTEGQ